MPQKGAAGGPDYRHVSLTTIAGTGQVISYDCQDESGRGQKGGVSKETAQETAVEFLRKYLQTGLAEMEMQVHPDAEEKVPDWVEQSKLGAKRSRPVISFIFNHVHQGVPVVDRAYSVRVDALTGKIVGFYHGESVSSLTLPDNRNVVSPEAAEAEFLQQYPPKLVYIWPEYFGQKAPSPRLIYIPKSGSAPGFYVDAFTGKTVKPDNS